VLPQTSTSKLPPISVTMFIYVREFEGYFESRTHREIQKTTLAPAVIGTRAHIFNNRYRFPYESYGDKKLCLFP